MFFYWLNLDVLHVIEACNLLNPIQASRFYHLKVRGVIRDPPYDLRNN